ncbi:hypothetical protein OC845_006536 [Tilletia horrida]|nr:hypothetical protein OC845_006536 [Tilletia horrida]
MSSLSFRVRFHSAFTSYSQGQIDHDISYYLGRRYTRSAAIFTSAVECLVAVDLLSTYPNPQAPIADVRDSVTYSQTQGHVPKNEEFTVTTNALAFDDAIKSETNLMLEFKRYSVTFRYKDLTNEESARISEAMEKSLGQDYKDPKVTFKGDRHAEVHVDTPLPGVKPEDAMKNVTSAVKFAEAIGDIPDSVRWQIPTAAQPATLITVNFSHRSLHLTVDQQGSITNAMRSTLQQWYSAPKVDFRNDKEVRVDLGSTKDGPQRNARADVDSAAKAAQRQPGFPARVEW